MPCLPGRQGGLSFSNVPGVDQCPSRGRSAGPDFSPMRNRGKNRQRRGLPPPCGIHPAVLGGRAPFSVRPLVRWGHIDGLPVYGLHLLLCWCILLPPGPYSGEPLFPAIGGRLPAAGTPHTGVRPWKQRHSITEKGMLSIDVPEHPCDPTKARAGHRIDAVPASYPKGGP